MGRHGFLAAAVYPQVARGRSKGAGKRGSPRSWGKLRSLTPAPPPNGERGESQRVPGFLPSPRWGEGLGVRGRSFRIPNIRGEPKKGAIPPKKNGRLPSDGL